MKQITNKQNKRQSDADDSTDKLLAAYHGYRNYKAGSGHVHGVAGAGVLGGLAGSYFAAKSRPYKVSPSSSSGTAVPGRLLLTGPKTSRVAGIKSRLPDADSLKRFYNNHIHTNRALMPGLAAVGGAYATHRYLKRAERKNASNRTPDSWFSYHALHDKNKQPAPETRGQRWSRRAIAGAAAVGGAAGMYKAAKPVARVLYDKATLGGRLNTNPMYNFRGAGAILGPGALVGAGALGAGHLASAAVKRYRGRKQQSKECGIFPQGNLREVSDNMKLRAFHKLYDATQKNPDLTNNARKMRQLARFSDAASAVMNKRNANDLNRLQAALKVGAVSYGLYKGVKAGKEFYRRRKEKTVQWNGLPTEKGYAKYYDTSKQKESFRANFEAHLRENGNLKEVFDVMLAGGLGHLHGEDDKREKRRPYGGAIKGAVSGAKVGGALGALGGGASGALHTALARQSPHHILLGGIGGAAVGGLSGATLGGLYGLPYGYMRRRASLTGDTHNRTNNKAKRIKSRESETDLAFCNLMESPRAEHKRFMKKAKQYSKLLSRTDDESLDPAVLAYKTMRSRGGIASGKVRQLRTAARQSSYGDSKYN